MTQQTTTTLQLREMILRGELAPGERVTEADIATRLGISRTPVRQALPALALEGLLVRSGQRGFAVREFKSSDSLDALRLRAVLEGYAARRVAEIGVAPALLRGLRECLAAGDALFDSRRLQEDDEVRYGEMNARFHALILEGSGVHLLPSLAARCNVVPFAGPDRIAFSEVGKQTMYDLLFYAHRQHHAIVDAMVAGQGDRAEFLFREHAISQEHSMSLGGDAASPRVSL
jgi:GntR family transcriptional regulator of vanillate catabolism